MLYFFRIADTTDYDTAEKLRRARKSRKAEWEGKSYAEYEIPPETPASLRTLVGHGLAFENAWCEDGTVSCVVSRRPRKKKT